MMFILVRRPQKIVSWDKTCFRLEKADHSNSRYLGQFQQWFQDVAQFLV